MSKKLTVLEAAEYLGVSKEAIYNRLRRGSLQSILEEGKKYVLLQDTTKQEAGKTRRTNSFKSGFENEYIELLKSQIQELKLQNTKLELDKENLIKEKENLLVESKEKIESIYKSRDEHIKAILTLANTKAIEHKNIDAKEEEIQEVDFEEEMDIVDQICESFEDWIELGEFLSQSDYTKEEAVMIEQKVMEELGKNKHVKKSFGDIFIKKNKKLKKIIGKF